MAASKPIQTKKSKSIVWFWQSDPSPRDTKTVKEWKRYSDFENEHIEEAFQRKEEMVSLNDYCIDFRQQLQIKDDDPQIQRVVKREIINVCDNVREERHLHTERATKSFTKQSFKVDFVRQWEYNYEDGMYTSQSGNIAELAAQGETLYYIWFPSQYLCCALSNTYRYFKRRNIFKKRFGRSKNG